MIVAAWLVLAAGLLTGVSARSDVRARAILAAHFPGQPLWPGNDPPFRFRTWAIAAAVTTVAVGASFLVQPVAALALAVLGAGVLGAISWRLRSYARACAGIKEALDAYAPRIAMPYSGVTGDHIGMWSPWVDRTGVPWCIVARTHEQFELLADTYETPIVQGVIPPSVHCALYCHGAPKNAVFIKHSSATHVFLGHGDSDKPLSASNRVLLFDLIAVAGQAAVDRFTAAGIDIPSASLRIIGRPQTEGIVAVTGPVPRPATVLYAPTWRHADDTLNVSSLAVADQLVQAMLERGCTVVFRRHFAGANHAAAEAMIVRVNEILSADASATGRQHRWGLEAMKEPLVATFNSVDAMVADVSGVVVDFLASQKPLLMYAAQFSDPEEFRVMHPTARAAYVIDRDLELLDGVLDDALGDDPLATTRAERADYHLGGSARSDPARRFLDLITELAEAERGSAVEGVGSQRVSGPEGS